MEIKESKNLFVRATPLIVLLVLPLLYADLMWGNRIYFKQRFRNASRPVPVRRTVEEKKQDDFLDSILFGLVKEKDREKFNETGFACNYQLPSLHCVTNKPVMIDTKTMTVFAPSDEPAEETVVRPYARQDDEVLLKTVSPVKILQGNVSTAPSVCQFSHDSPAVIFSTSGYVGNFFHEINDMMIPLYITSSKFKSRVVFIVEEYNAKFMKIYDPILSALTSHEIINPAVNSSVHCFPGAVVGLMYHDNLAVNSSEIPTGLSMTGFRHFLRKALNLKHNHVSEIKQPTVLLLSRRATRRIINEEEVVTMMRELGFRVIVIARNRILSNLKAIGSLVNSCSVFVAVHGAGVTNDLFLPDGAVMVQFDLVGLEWASRTYYGDTAGAMHVRYLRYKIEPEESSLLKIFGRKDHIAFKDPGAAFPREAGREVFLNGQNVRINITRFRETMVEAMSLVVRDLPL